MRALARHPLIDEILDARRDFARGHMPAFEGVPKAIARLALGWLPRHPFRPAPVFRGGAALRRTGRG
jgi:hypothetical protein